LKDTVQPFDGTHGNGIVIKDHSKNSLVEAMEEARARYGNKKQRTRLVTNALASDFRWDRSSDPSVDRYVALFDEAISGKK
jgi:glycogen synthase